MATARQYIEAAARYIGVGGTDNVFNTWIWGQHVYDPNSYPWCAAFQSYVGVHDLGMPFNPSASAAGVGWQGTRVADSDVRPGDWVLFNWDGRQDFGWADHIGVVEWSDINGSGYFGTIEGNTGGGEGSVMRCTRYNWGGYATAFFRPPYDGQEGGGHYDESEEDEMTVWGYKNEAISSKDVYSMQVDTYTATQELLETVRALSADLVATKKDVAATKKDVAATKKDVAAVKKTVDGIKVGGVNVKAVAKAVNDDAAKRMQS